MMITYRAQFTCSHVLCYISDCLMGPQGVCVNTPPGLKHSYFHTPRVNQPSPMRTLSPPLLILSTTEQSSYRLRRNFPWHGTSFPRSTIHIHPQRRETSFALLTSTTRSSLRSCSRRGGIQINCFRRVVSRNFVPKSTVLSNASTLSTFQRLLT